MTVVDARWPSLDLEHRQWPEPGHDLAGPPTRRRDRLHDRLHDRLRDRVPGSFEAAVPPSIAQRPVGCGPAVAAVLDAAAQAVVALDASTTVDLTALAGALLRSESVASSKIEHLSASQAEVGLAMLRGVPVHAAAAHVAANVRAMTAALAQGDEQREYHVADVLALHRLLLEADPYEGGWAGRVRDMQNWVGGGDRSPHGALFVPPAPQRVPGLLDDLVRFCRRTDVHPVAQAAVAHAQFETIHPFTDGNGRTGRALVHVVLRRRGLARRTVVPVSTVLLADVEGYFEGLDDYRAGRLDAWLARFAAATSVAASAGQGLANDLAAVRQGWYEAVRPRRGSAVATLTEALLRQPVVDIDVLRTLAGGVADTNVYAAVSRLEAAGVLTELSGGGRNQVWAALDVLDLLERFETRLGRRRPF